MSYYEMPVVAVLQMIGEVVPILRTIGVSSRVSQFPSLVFKVTHPGSQCVKE
jgi:hypothetical protein